METQTLLYIILGLQITLVLFIILSAIVVWLKFGRRAADIFEATEKITGWAAKTFLPQESATYEKKEDTIVFHRAELADATTREYRRILVKGELAHDVYEAMHLCSESNLEKLHSAFPKGPEAMRTAIDEIDPELEQLEVIEHFLGPSLVAALAYNYKINNYYEHGQELSLTRKSPASHETAAAFQ